MMKEKKQKEKIIELNKICSEIWEIESQLYGARSEVEKKHHEFKYAEQKKISLEEKLKLLDAKKQKIREILQSESDASELDDKGD